MIDIVNCPQRNLLEENEPERALGELPPIPSTLTALW
jgi:hypothetical protein